jgi:hypothetical protein
VTEQYADQATADAFLRKQVVLTAVVGAVAAAVLVAATRVLDAQERARLVAFGLGDAEAGSAGPSGVALGAIVVSLVVLTIALGTLVLHAARLAAFAFRKEVH